MTEKLIKIMKNGQKERQSNHVRASKLNWEKARLEAKKEVFDDVEDLLENYRGKYFKINIDEFNKLKESLVSSKKQKEECSRCKGMATLPMMINCPDCNGKGYTEEFNYDMFCHNCKGTGKVDYEIDDVQETKEEDCPNCQGRGWNKSFNQEIKTECQKCYGTGKQKEVNL